jgi:prevent-host-death family protein
MAVDVAVTELRAHLSAWLARASAGDEVVITDRGTPVARLLGVGSTSVLERLVLDGAVSSPKTTQRPTAKGRPRVRASRVLADVVSEQRR